MVNNDETPRPSNEERPVGGEESQEEVRAAPQEERDDRGQEDGEGRNPRNVEEASEFGMDWRNTFNYFFDRPEEKKLVEALYSPEKFYRYVEHIREEQGGREKRAVIESTIRQHNPGVGGSQIEEMVSYEVGRRVSEELETRIILAVSKIYLSVDKTYQSQPFEEVEQTGSFYNTIRIAKDVLLKRFDLLVQTIEGAQQSEALEKLRRLRFFKRYSEESLTPELVDGRIIPQTRVIPTAGIKNVGLAEFLNGLHTEIDKEIDTRRYLHNLGVIFSQGASGEQGFWGQLAGYAKRFQSLDIDTVPLLLDSNIFMTAARLYTKYIEEEFAQKNWTHQPNMFTADIHDVRPKIVQRVMKDLKLLHKDELGNSTENDWRLRRAVSMGIGLARGVFMTEPELAASADPHRDLKTGAPTFASYYSSDGIALNALNPKHHFLRWQQEGVLKGPLMFLPVEGLKDKSRKYLWDHRDLYKKMKAYQEAYVKGEAAFKDVREAGGERLLIDTMPNFGRMGSVITRGGWRMYWAYRGWVIFKTDEDPYVRDTSGEVIDINTNKINYLESWKALENIGFEALTDFTSRIIGEDDLDDEFLKYLYRKYISPDKTDGGFGDFKTEQGRAAQSKLEELVKKGKVRPENKKEYAKELEKLVNGGIINRALFGILAQRMPTKFIRIERDSQSADGKRAWEKLREELGWDFGPMDEAMRDLILVETSVRNRTSVMMQEHLRQKERRGEEHSLNDFSTDKYIVDEQTIKEVLNALGRDPDRALQLFDKIKTGYLTDKKFASNFTEKIAILTGHDKDLYRPFPFALATEELDTSFLAFRNTGPRTLERALSDTAQAETVQFKAMGELLKHLKDAAIDPKRDMGKLVELIQKVQESSEMIIGQPYSYKLAYDLAAMTISYFRKDTKAINLLTKWFRVGQFNSLAAEFSGTLRGVWEWEQEDINKFIYELERNRILPKDPYSLTKDPKVDGKWRKPDFEYYTGKLRREFGATGWQRAWEATNKYLPLFFILMLYASLKKAFEEEGVTGKKGR